MKKSQVVIFHRSPTEPIWTKTCMASNLQT